MLASMDWTQLQPVIILLVVAIIARFNPIPSHYHPSQLLGLGFTAIANKVNNPQRSHKQQQIAGALSVIFMLSLRRRCFVLSMMWNSYFRKNAMEKWLLIFGRRRELGILTLV